MVALLFPEHYFKRSDVIGLKSLEGFCVTWMFKEITQTRSYVQHFKNILKWNKNVNIYFFLLNVAEKVILLAKAEAIPSIHPFS